MREPKAQEVHQPASHHATSLLPPTLRSSGDGHPRQGSEVGSWEQTYPCCSGQSQQIPIRLSTTQQDAENVANKILELLLTFGIPLFLRNDPGTEFTAEVVKHLCKWLHVTIDYGPTDHLRAQGAVEWLGGSTLWLHWTIPDPRLPGKANPFRLLFGRDCRTQIDATSPSSDDEGMDELRNRNATSENLRQVQTFATTYSTAMSRDAFNESTTTQGSAAPLPEPE